MTLKILIAPNAFKNSLDAVTAATSIAKGLQRSQLDCHCLLQPIADGGDGMLTVMLSQEGATEHKAVVDGPLGRRVEAAYGLLEGGKTAVIEMAEASGIRLLSPEELNPMKTSTYGTGQLIRAALDAGAQEIVIGIGGSATVDLGLGMTQALGIQLINSQGKPVIRGGAGVEQLSAIDMSSLDQRIRDTRIFVTCDVTNTLSKAPSVFGPQKGASKAMVQRLENAFEKAGKLIEKSLGKKVMHVRHGGAAGGLGAALFAFLGAELLDGTDYLLSRTGFHQALLEAELVITAEGALDMQTQSGKGPFYVARAAREQQKPVVMLAGSLPKDYDPDTYQVYDVVLPIGPRPEPLEEALKNTSANLERTALQVGNMLALSTKKMGRT